MNAKPGKRPGEVLGASTKRMARPQMEMIGAIENMNLTLQIPDDSIAAEFAQIERRPMRKGSQVPRYFE
jgi:hypothetical protein